MITCHYSVDQELIEKTRERQSATLSEVTWRGRTVPVKSERVRVCLLTAQESTKQLAETTDVESKLSVYETLLKELIDAQQALREDFKDDAVSYISQFCFPWWDNSFVKPLNTVWSISVNIIYSFDYLFHTLNITI